MSREDVSGGDGSSCDDSDDASEDRPPVASLAAAAPSADSGDAEGGECRAFQTEAEVQSSIYHEEVQDRDHLLILEMLKVVSVVPFQTEAEVQSSIYHEEVQDREFYNEKQWCCWLIQR